MKPFMAYLLTCFLFCSIEAAERHAVPSSTGELIGEDGKPVFLISTTVDWNTREAYHSYKDHFLKDKRWRIPKGFEWLYAEPTSVSMLERCGFNAVNFRNFACISHRTLAPEYKGFGKEDPFDEYIKVVKKYGLQKVQDIKERRPFDEFCNLVRSAASLPVYLDFHGAEISSLPRNRHVASKLLNPAKYFASPDIHPGFAIRWRLGTKEGREALKGLYRHEAQMHLSLGIRPFAYKLFNEADFRDHGPLNYRLFMRAMQKKYGTIAKLNQSWHTDYKDFADLLQKNCKAKQIEYAKFMEGQVADFFAEVRTMLRELDPGAVTFGQVHGYAWRAGWNNFNLYKINRQMDLVSFGTGNYSFPGEESIEDETPAGAADAPSSSLENDIARRAFYHALAERKPLVTSEAYFPGQKYRYDGFKKVFWHEMVNGSSLVNMWQWMGYWTPWRQNLMNNYALHHPNCVRPQDWRALQDARREIDGIKDFFMIRANREKAKVAVLFSYPTLRANNSMLDYYAQTVTGLVLRQIPVDAILEEQLNEGRQDRYRVILAFGIKNSYRETGAKLLNFVRNGGVLITDAESFRLDEYDYPLKNSIMTLSSEAGSGKLRTLPSGIKYIDNGTFSKLSDEWSIKQKVGTKPLIVSRTLGKGSIIVTKGQYSTYGVAELLIPYLKSAGIAESVQLCRYANGLAPINIGVQKARQKGMTAWYFVNYDRKPQLIRASSEDFRNTVVVNYLKNETYPVDGNTVVLLLEANTHLVAVSGERTAIEKRFGRKPSVPAGVLKERFAEMCSAFKKDRVRPSQPVRLESFANYGFDNQQGWSVESAWKEGKEKDLRGVPFERQIFRKLQFHLIRFDYNNNKTCIALKSKHLPDAPQKVEHIPLRGRFRGVAFLHAVTNAVPGENAAIYRFFYEDGSSVSQPIRVGQEIGSWLIRQNSESLRSRVVWQNFGKGLFLYEWENPYPARMLKSVTLESMNGSSVPIIAGISSIPSIYAKEYPKQIRFSDVMTVDPKQITPEGEYLSLKQRLVFKTKDGLPLKLSSQEWKNAVLRFQLKLGKDKFGKQETSQDGCRIYLYGKINGSFASTFSWSAAGVERHIGAALRNPDTFDEWNEVEVPIGICMDGQTSDGKRGTLSDITKLSYDNAKLHLLRNLRIEYQ